jgi:hypothetical protein
MTRRRRLSGGKKVVLYIVGLLIAWQFLKLPEIIDAFLTFCLAGVVPGTDVVLAPETVMQIAGITVGTIIVLAALRPIIRRLFAKNTPETEVFTQPESTITNSPETVVASDITQQVEPVVTPAEAFRQQIYVREAATLEVLDAQEEPKQSPAWLLRLRGSITALLDKAMPRIITMLVKAAVMIQPTWQRATATAATYAQAIRVRAMKDLWWAVAQLKAFWRWLVPYLWQFDGWLGVKAQAIENRLKHKIDSHDAASTVVDLSRHAKKTIGEINVQTKVKKATTKAKPYAKKAKATAKKAHATAKKATVKAKTAANKARKTSKRAPKQK